MPHMVTMSLPPTISISVGGNGKAKQVSIFLSNSIISYKSLKLVSHAKNHFTIQSD